MSEIPTINVNMDKACSACGEPGACQNGMCLKCNGKNLTEKLRWKIGDKTIGLISETLKSMLWQYQAEINRAYTLTPGELSISLTAKICPSDGTNEVKCGISFTLEKLKAETDKVYVDEDQMDLGFES